MLFKEITAEEFADIRAKEAYEDGEQAGLKKGETIGLQKGEAMKQREIAKNMLQESMPKSVIAKITGLSVEEVESL